MKKCALIQSSFGGTVAENIARAQTLVRQAANDDAKIILLPELFEHPYFCKTQRADFLQYAMPAAENSAVQAMQALAAELDVVLPVSFYEHAGNARFNSVAMIDAGGEVLGIYRKSHIPDGPGYQEKFYFSPGDTGFRVWRTKHGNVGVGVCWDQWFPEAARAMALMGADVLLYPTAIGDEPHQPAYDSSAHWQMTMRGHAAANVIPLLAANRVGEETQDDVYGNNVRMRFYGRSFITDGSGAKLKDAEDNDGVILTASFDFDDIAKQRAAWGLFRDRRPELYGALARLDGSK